MAQTPTGCRASPSERLARLLRMNDAARRLYTALGRLPDGWEFDAVDQLLPGDVDDAAQGLLGTRLVYPEAGRLRMLGPVRASTPRPSR